MNHFRFFRNILTIVFCVLATMHLSAQNEREFYQLKIYSFKTVEQVETTDAYLKDGYLPALKTLGYSPVGVFKQHQVPDSTITKTFVLVPFDSLSELVSLEAKIDTLQSHSSAGAPYLDAPHDRPAYERIETILLRAFVDMPKMAVPKLNGPRPERIYELRSYESPSEKLYKNKVDMFNAGGEVPLFEDLGFNAVFYGEVLSGSNMPNLMYMTAHENEEAQTENWKAFVDSPVWKALKARPEYQNNVSHIDKFMLYPTDYSDY